MKKTFLFWMLITGSLFFAGVALSQGISKPDPTGYRIMYQEGVDVTVTKDGKTTEERIAVYGVAGLPFPVERIEVDRRGKVGNTVIDIEETKEGLLIPKKDCAVPINMGFGENNEFGASFFTHAVNVTWRFTKSGIRFESKGKVYRVQKAGATISFTQEGVKMDGVNTVPKGRK